MGTEHEPGHHEGLPPEHHGESGHADPRDPKHRDPPTHESGHTGEHEHTVSPPGASGHDKPPPPGHATSPRQDRHPAQGASSGTHATPTSGNEHAPRTPLSELPVWTRPTVGDLRTFAGERPDVKADPTVGFKAKIWEGVGRRADRLETAWRDLKNATFNTGARVSSETERALKEALDQGLSEQLFAWQDLVDHEPFNITGITQGAQKIHETLSTYRERLEAFDFDRHADQQGAYLRPGLEAIADAMAEQLAEAGAPLAALTETLQALGSRADELPTTTQLIKDRVQGSLARHIDQYWRDGKTNLFRDARKRASQKDSIPEIEKVFDLGLSDILADWQDEVASGRGDAEALYEKALRAAEVLRAYHDRLEALQASDPMGLASYLQRSVIVLSRRIAMELGRANWRSVKTLTRELDAVGGDGESTPPDARLDAKSKAVSLDRFWKDAKARELRAVKRSDAKLAKLVDEAFDLGLRTELAKWNKVRSRDRLSAREVHEQAGKLRDILGEYRARLADLGDPSTRGLDDALRLMALRTSETLDWLQREGGFMEEQA